MPLRPLDTYYSLDMVLMFRNIWPVSWELVTNYLIDGINWDDEINGDGYLAGFTSSV